MYIIETTQWQRQVEEAAQIVLSSRSPTPSVVAKVRVGLAMLAVVQDDAEGAAEQFTYLRSLEPRTLFRGMICLARLLGLLSKTMRQPDGAVAYFKDALEFCQNAGYRPELAWTCYEYAESLLARNAPSDYEKALNLLDEALVIVEELGMRPLKARIIARQENSEVPRNNGNQPPRWKYLDGLSEREVEVLQLVAQGKSNSEIGDELFISHRTVSTHLTNIFNKTNTSNRTEAAAYATRHGLA